MKHTKTELHETVRAIQSSINKCEKAREKLKKGSPQRKWIDRQLQAFYISLAYVESKPDEMRRHSEPERQNAVETLELLIGKCEPLLAKFEDGTPQKTLAIRRLRAFQIAVALISKREG